jgi:predicted nucleic acid-binding protein
MIAADTSAMVAYLKGQPGGDRLTGLIKSRELVLPPIAPMEVLSSPVLDEPGARNVIGLPILEILPGYWERAGRLRAALLRNGLKAGIADPLIAQSCINHDVPLITLDRDFRHYVRFGGLRIAS